MAKILLLYFVAFIAAYASYPGVAIFNSYKFYQGWIDYEIKKTHNGLPSEVEIPLYSLPITDDTYTELFLADQIFNYNYNTNCTYVSAGEDYNTMRMYFSSSFHLTGNIEITSNTAQNILANFKYIVNGALLSIDTKFFLKDGYVQFSGKLNSLELPKNNTFTLVDSGDVPLPSPAQQQIIKNIILKNEKYIVDDLLIAFTSLVNAGCDLVNGDWHKSTFDTYTRQDIDTRQVTDPVRYNGTTEYVAFFANGTFLDHDTLSYDPHDVLDQPVTGNADNVYRYSDWWMAQYLYVNFKQPSYSQWLIILSKLKQAIPQLSQTYGPNEDYILKFAPASQPTVGMLPDYQTLAISILFTITPRSNPSQPGLTLLIFNQIKAKTQFTWQDEYPNAGVQAQLLKYFLVDLDVIQSNLTEKVDTHALDDSLTQIAENYVLPYYMGNQLPKFLTGLVDIWYHTYKQDWGVTFENGYMQLATNSTNY